MTWRQAVSVTIPVASGVGLASLVPGLIVV